MYKTDFIARLLDLLLFSKCGLPVCGKRRKFGFICFYRIGENEEKLLGYLKLVQKKG